MKKAFLIFCIQAGLAVSALAQFDTPEKMQVNAVKGKVLLVETQVEVTRTLMDLRATPEKQQAYKDGVANFNQMMKDAAEKYFKWNKGAIEYMPVLDVEKLVRDGKASKYAILHYGIQGGQVNPMDIGPVYSGKYTDSVREFSRNKGFGIISVQLAGPDKKVKDVFTVALPVAYPSGADMVYAMEMIHNVFYKTSKVRDYKVNDFRDDIDKYNKLLKKKKTLLIEKGQLTSKTTYDDLKKGYSGPLEIVDYEKIQNAILQNDSQYAYVMVVPIKPSAANSGAIKSVLKHLVVDAADGKVLGSAKPGRMNYNSVAQDITRKEVKEYIEE